jgi:hypothetical protein
VAPNSWRLPALTWKITKFTIDYSSIVNASNNFRFRHLPTPGRKKSQMLAKPNDQGGTNVLPLKKRST